MRATAKQYNWKLTGKFEACEHCQKSNVQQKGVPKQKSNPGSTVPGERLYLDCSSVTNHASLGGASVWLGLSDEATGITFSRLMKQKAELPEETLRVLQTLRDKGYTTKFIRCDDAKEHKVLQKKCESSSEQWLREIKFEYTARNTPQLNGKIERRFAVITRRVRATLNAAMLTEDLRQVLWGEAVMFCTDIDNCILSKAHDKPAYLAFYKQMLPGIENLHQFGEIAYVKFHKKIQGKLKDRGIPMMYLGRALNHSADTHRFMNLETKKIINSRDATWINKVYGQWKNLDLPTSPEQVSMIPVDLDAAKPIKQAEEAEPEPPVKTDPAIKADPVEVRQDQVKNQDQPRPDSAPESREEPEPVQAPVKKAKPVLPPRTMATRRTQPDDSQTPVQASEKALRELARLEGTLNPEATTLAERLRESANQEVGGVSPQPPPQAEGEQATPLFTLIDRFGGDIGEFAEIGLSAVEKLDPATFKDKFEAPTKFRDAWDHPDEFQRVRWRAAIEKELDKMHQKGVWKKIKRKDMTAGRRCVKHKWVFDIKRSGIFRARLVACGYSQVPGQDFNQVFSPVANDITFRIVITVMIVYQLRSLIFDVETAFLAGDLEELIYMDCPEGMEHEDDECLLLIKTIYGLVQSARQYNRKFNGVLRRIGFRQCESDPCLFMRKDEAGLCFVLTYVDDNLCVGTDEAIKKLIREIQASELSITIDEGLTDYLSGEIQLSEDKKKGWIGQPHMVKKIIKTFEAEIQDLPEYKTPGRPSFGIVSPAEGEQILEDELQSRY